MKSNEVRDIVLLGPTGGIGSATLEMLTQQNKHQVVGLINSKVAVFDETTIKTVQEAVRNLGLKHEDQSRAAIRKVMNNHTRIEIQADELMAVLEEQKLSEKTVFVDATSADNYELHERQLSRGASVVTAAKGQIVNHNMDAYRILMDHSDRYGYESTILAGRGAIDLLRQQREIGDEVINLQLVSSGSIGGTLAALAKGKKMEEACRLNDASFEPEPYLDLSGKDLGGKLLTALRELGLEYDLSDIDQHIEGLVGPEYAGLSKGDFYEKVRQENQRFADIMKQAQKESKKPVYVASFNVSEDGERSVSVKMELLDKQSVMGALEGSENIIRVTTRGMQGAGDGPDRLIGAGAGRYATAKGLINDIRNV